MKKIISGLTIIMVFVFSACTKKDNSNPTPTGTDSVKMEFYHAVNGQGLNLGNEWYQNANGDSFMVTTFNYYISNVVLKGDSGTSDYAEPNSYHLVEAPSSSVIASSFDIQNVPLGHYSAVTFMIGVDSLHDVSGAQTGALDPLNGMFWSWNTGYIMLKFEGNSPQSPQANGYIEFHCGGFSGANSVLKTVTLLLPNDITTNKYQEPHIHFLADVDALFASPNKINFATEPLVNLPGAEAKQIADNYANMFTVTYAGF